MSFIVIFRQIAYRDDTTFFHEIEVAKNEGRITHVPYDSSLVVNTYWDVGVVDYTVIWFVQEKDEYLDIIDCDISRGKDFKFLLNVLRIKGYKYGKNVLPHDMGRRQPPRLDTRLAQANEIAIELLFEPFALGRMYMRDQMISKAREQLARCRFDAVKCQKGLNCLIEFNATKRKSNSNSNIMTDVADSFCYLAMDAKTKKARELINFDTRMGKIIDEYNADSIALDYNPFNTKGYLLWEKMLN